MARPLRIEFAGAFYHIIQRGLEKRNIFGVEADKKKFLSFLETAHTAYRAVFHSYVLMDNHFHLILETPQAFLSKIMHFINAGYAVYFNTKYKRIGPLYQGRFKAVLVQQDEYLHYLSCYIHLNPARAGVEKLPENYLYSSYNYFVSNEQAPSWLNTDFILSMFDENTVKAKSFYKQFINDNMGKEKDILSRNTKFGILLGNDKFLAGIKEKLIEVKEEREVPVLKAIKQDQKHNGGFSLEKIKSIAESVARSDKRLARSLAIYLCRKYTGKSLNEIAEFYGGIKYTGVSRVWRRMETRKETNNQIRQILSRAERKLNEVSSVKT